MRELALFAGAGGGVLGGVLCGWRTVAAVEIEDYPRRVLLQRQADGVLPRFPIWDDIRTFDGRPWRGMVDIITGGFPCQDISAAGRGAGLAGQRSGLWSEMARVIREVQPRFAFVENSPMLTGRGLDRVLLDLAEMGYNARWCVLGADDAGAPHVRKRIWILAYPSGPGLEGQRLDAGRAEVPKPRDCGALAHPVCDGTEKRLVPVSGNIEKATCGTWGRARYEPRDSGALADADPVGLQRAGTEPEMPGRGEPADVGWWDVEPELGRVAHGVAHRVDRLKAIGNGQVPAVVKLAWDILSEGLI